MWKPERDCPECGEETSRPEGSPCDECTGALRLFCEGCGRTDLKAVERRDGYLRFTTHNTPDGHRCYMTEGECGVMN